MSTWKSGAFAELKLEHGRIRALHDHRVLALAAALLAILALGILLIVVVVVVVVVVCRLMTRHLNVQAAEWTLLAERALAIDRDQLGLGRQVLAVRLKVGLFRAIALR